MAQITGYLTPVQAAAFQNHAASGGLDVSALANLLIVRELRTKRLPILKMDFDVDLPPGERMKVTAHQRLDITKEAFAAHAAETGLKPSPAAAILFRAELKERWLTFSLGVNQFDSV